MTNLNDPQMSIKEVLKQSMIRQDKQAGFFVKCISKVDIFSFIPVPKSRPVSTRCSLVGTVIFFSIFFGYVIYDLVKFISDNPPLPNTFYQDLSSSANYSSPNFSIIFMEGEELENQVNPDGIFNFSLKQNLKKQKSSDSVPSMFVPCDRNMTNWINNQTFDNYNQTMKCPSPDVPLYLKGLLYVDELAWNPSIKVSQCLGQGCQSRENINKFQAGGRLFLFLQRKFSSSDTVSRDRGYLLYNFFLVQEVYNRINIQFQVTKQIVLPNYLTSWTTEQSERLELFSVTEMNSNVVPNNNTPDSKQRGLLLSVQFTLSPTVKVTKIACSTLIDHVAQWGALWGIQFAIFAIIFLSYNSRKYYRKNPKWSFYDKNEELNQEDNDALKFDRTDGVIRT